MAAVPARGFVVELVEVVVELVEAVLEPVAVCAFPVEATEAARTDKTNTKMGDFIAGRSLVRCPVTSVLGPRTKDSFMIHDRRGIFKTPFESVWRSINLADVGCGALALPERGM